jgi:hypothetical protein
LKVEQTSLFDPWFNVCQSCRQLVPKGRVCHPQKNEDVGDSRQSGLGEETAPREQAVEEPGQKHVRKLPPHQKGTVLVNVPRTEVDENRLAECLSGQGRVVHELQKKKINKNV